MKKDYLIQSTFFLLSILFISYSYWLWAFLILLVIFLYGLLKKENWLITLNILSFLIGFMLHQYLSFWIKGYFTDGYLKILLDRCLLIIIVLCFIPFSLICKKPLVGGFNKPLWSNPIYFPYIWRGSSSIKILYFLLQAVLINIVIFIPFILKQQVYLKGSVILFAILFSLLNATFEEMIWRGILLHGFRDILNNTTYAIIFTSIGFGLQHISMGISLLPALLFSFGGVWFSIVYLRSHSIYPSIIWHMIINIGMVLSGFIS